MGDTDLKHDAILVESVNANMLAQLENIEKKIDKQNQELTNYKQKLNETSQKLSSAIESNNLEKASQKQDKNDFKNDFALEKQFTKSLQRRIKHLEDILFFAFNGTYSENLLGVSSHHHPKQDDGSIQERQCKKFITDTCSYEPKLIIEGFDKKHLSEALNLSNCNGDRSIVLTQSLGLGFEVDAVDCKGKLDDYSCENIESESDKMMTVKDRADSTMIEPLITKEKYISKNEFSTVKDACQHMKNYNSKQEKIMHFLESYKSRERQANQCSKQETLIIVETDTNRKINNGCSTQTKAVSDASSASTSIENKFTKENVTAMANNEDLVNKNILKGQNTYQSSSKVVHDTCIDNRSTKKDLHNITGKKITNKNDRGTDEVIIAANNSHGISNGSPYHVQLSDRVLEGSITWLIRKRKPTVTEIIFHSGIFYTDNPGYRVQLRAQIDRLHGDVYFSVRVLKGLFDESLEWPFQQKFCIRLSRKMKFMSPDDWVIPVTHVWKKTLTRPKHKKDDIFSEWCGPFDISAYLEKKLLVFDLSLVK